MRTKFATLLSSILFSIFRAENTNGKGAGKEKQKQVYHDLVLRSAQLGILPSPDSKFAPGIFKAIIAVIQAVVALLNALGIFESAESTD